MHFQADRRKHPKQQTPRHQIDTSARFSYTHVIFMLPIRVCALCYCHWDANRPAPRHAASHPITVWEIPFRRTLWDFKHGFDHQPEVFDTTACSRQYNPPASFTCHCRDRTPPGRGGCTRTLRKRTSARSFKRDFQTSTSALSRRSTSDLVSLDASSAMM